MAAARPIEPGDDRGGPMVPSTAGPAEGAGRSMLLNPANALTLLRVVLVPVIAWLLLLDGDNAR